jgi:restriction system protein
MADVTTRRSGELVQGVFRILADNPDGLPVKQVLERLQSVVPPTSFENSVYPKRPDIRRYEKIVRFSTIAAVKAGWLQKSKGYWSLTDEGRSALTRYKDPLELQRESVRLYKQWESQQPDDVAIDPPAEAPAVSTILEEATEASWTEVEEHLKKMSPYDFQNLVAGLIKGMGYHVTWIAPPGPDRGIDVIAHTNPLGIVGPRIKVQVKRTNDRIPVKEIRSFMAVLSDGDVGIYVALGGFTTEAANEARHQEKRRLMLLDLEKLFDLWSEHYERIPERERRLLPLKPVWFLSLSDGL